VSRTQPFVVSATVVLNGSGAGTASVGPSITNEKWDVTVASVKVATNVNEATASVYAGAAFAGSTTWGSTGDSTSNFSSPIWPGQQVTATWEGGDADKVATLIVQGIRTVP
jgi:hypothetical protein